MDTGFIIGELEPVKSVKDSDLFILEDNDDTKHVTFKNLKQSMIGDEGSENAMYSAAKVDALLGAINRELSTRVSTKDYDSLKAAVDDIAASQRDSDGEMVDITELVVARDGEKSLSDRLNRDMKANENTLMHKYKRQISGKRIDLLDFEGYGNIFLDVDPSTSANVIVHSANYFDIERMRGANEAYISYSRYGFTYKQFSVAGDNFCGVFVPVSVPVGNYYFSTNLYVDDVVDNGQTKRFNLTTVEVGIKYSDKTVYKFVTSLKGMNNSLFSFQMINTKPVVEISFVFPEEDFVENSTLRFENIMINPNRLITEFIEYKVDRYPLQGKRWLSNMPLGKCEIYVDGFATNLILEFYDNKYDTAYIVDSIKELTTNMNEEIDQCGMMESYGSINYLSGGYHIVRDTDSGDESCIVLMDDEKLYNRNGHRSVGVNMIASTDAIVSFPLSDVPNEVETCTILFYSDPVGTTRYLSEDAIEVHLVCDAITTYPYTSYYRTFIPKSTIVQGWNSYKFELSECEMIGSPNGYNTVTNATFIIKGNPALDFATIRFNTVTFNQRMKPVALIGFNSIQNKTLEYILPTMFSRGLSYTLFLNDSINLSNAVLDFLISHRVTGGLDIGQWGCNPNRELLMENDNHREQYIALKNIREYLRENMVYNPVSYGAPDGDLRFITNAILKEMGYKIAKTTKEGLCPFFSKKDMCIPSYEINNGQDIDMVKTMIDTAVRTGQAISISTYDITPYGDEINASQADFNEILDYIQTYVDAGKMEVMSYKEFADKCY